MQHESAGALRGVYLQMLSHVMATAVLDGIHGMEWMKDDIRRREGAISWSVSSTYL